MMKYCRRHSCKQNGVTEHKKKISNKMGKNPQVQQTDKIFYGKTTTPIVGVLRELPESKK